MNRRWSALLSVGLLLEAFIVSAHGVRADVRRLIERISPQKLEQKLYEQPELIRPTADLLIEGLSGADAELRSDTAGFWVSLARAAFERLGSRGGPWPQSDLDYLLTIQLLDPERFVRDPSFRSRSLEALPRQIPDDRYPELRDRHLYELNQLINFDFEASELVESAWGAVPRASGPREISLKPEELSIVETPDRKIQMSFFSLPSAFFDPSVVAGFLRHLRSLTPERDILILTDQPVVSRLKPLVRELRIVVLDSYGRHYSTWPRDPFTPARSAEGRFVLMVRPYFQQGREEDTFLARELIQTLPPDIDHRLGGLRWARSPVPFHNGNILAMPDEIWISVHTLERRVLELIGADAVPVASFASAAGLDRYLTAAAQAARELERLYGKQVRFVHPLPATGRVESRSRMMHELGGGAGFDLDSLLTVLPGNGRMTAFVADVNEGRRMMQGLPDEEWKGFQAAYGLDSDLARLQPAIDASQITTRAAALQQYLDLIASHLRAEGAHLVRVPLVLVPTALLLQREGLTHGDFLLTWNNVVPETREGRQEVEGFASLIASADRMVSERFKRAGWQLHLLPPLVRSIILNGGYRCASSHFRELRPSPSRN